MAGTKNERDEEDEELNQTLTTLRDKYKRAKTGRNTQQVVQIGDGSQNQPPPIAVETTVQPVANATNVFGDMDEELKQTLNTMKILNKEKKRKREDGDQMAIAIVPTQEQRKSAQDSQVQTVLGTQGDLQMPNATMRTHNRRNSTQDSQVQTVLGNATMPTKNQRNSAQDSQLQMVIRTQNHQMLNTTVLGDESIKIGGSNQDNQLTVQMANATDMDTTDGVGDNTHMHDEQVEADAETARRVEEHETTLQEVKSLLDEPKKKSGGWNWNSIREKASHMKCWFELIVALATIGEKLCQVMQSYHDITKPSSK